MAQLRQRRGEGLLSPCCSSFLFHLSPTVSPFPPTSSSCMSGQLGWGGGQGLRELRVTTLLSLSYSSSSSSSSGDPAVPLKLLTRGAKRPGEVGSHPGGKLQKSASYRGGRDPSPRGERAGARGQEPGWQELSTAPRGHQPGTALVGKLQTSDLGRQPPVGLAGPSARFSELSVCLSGGPLPPPCLSSLPARTLPGLFCALSLAPAFYTAAPLTSAGILPVMQSLCPDGQRDEFGFLQYSNST